MLVLALVLVLVLSLSLSKKFFVIGKGERSAMDDSPTSC
jgi:hypothetical protein